MHADVQQHATCLHATVLLIVKSTRSDVADDCVNAVALACSNGVSGTGVRQSRLTSDVLVCGRLASDDSMSGASVSDVNDRLAALELRVQQQEDELTVMKAALADVLRRLDASETSAAATKKQHGGKSKEVGAESEPAASVPLGCDEV